jgi:uncharacterized protein (TIGR02001 family)
MKNPRKNMLVLRVVLGITLPSAIFSTALSAHAADSAAVEPDYSFTYNVGAVTDYRVRGISQTSGQPALQGGIDFAHKSGLYVGVAGSNVKWVKELNGATKGSYEVDLYGGFKAQIDDTGLSYDVGAIRYNYPGNNSGVGGALPAGTFVNASTTELYGALTYKIYTLKYNRSVTDFLGNVNSSGSQYFDLSAAVDMTNGFTLTPHIGRQLIPNQPIPGSYTDYALTLAKDFGNGLVATAAVMSTNADKTFYTDTKGRYLGNTTLVVGAKYSF